MSAMHLNLLSLPRKAFENILDLLSERTIIQLRQVCKTVNESVCTVVGTRETEIKRFMIKQVQDKDDGKIMLNIQIMNRRQYFLWQCSFLHILRKQKLSGLSQFVEIVSEHDCHLFRIFGNVIPEDVACFLEHFKCLTSHTKFSELTLDSLELKIIRMLSDFLKSKFIQCVNIYHWDESTPSHILLEKVRTDLIYYEFSMFNQSIADFLLQLATMTKSMITRVTSPTTNRLSASFVNEILSRKCNKLEINTEMSLDEMEMLLQYFHHSDKTIKLRISAWYSGIYIDTQFGVYTAKTDYYGRKHIIPL